MGGVLDHGKSVGDCEAEGCGGVKAVSGTPVYSSGTKRHRTVIGWQCSIASSDRGHLLRAGSLYRETLERDKVKSGDGIEAGYESQM